MQKLNLFNHVSNQWELVSIDTLGHEELSQFLPQKPEVQNRFRQYILMDTSSNSTKKAFLQVYSEGN